MDKYFLTKKPAVFYVDVLGIIYEIIFKTEEEDEILKEVDGYCDNTTNQIIIKFFENHPMNHNDMMEYAERCIRHEIIHAFLYQSGLDVNSINQWARNEEMVDWFAIQLNKINFACNHAAKKFRQNKKV